MTVLDAKPEGQQKEVLDMLVRWYADYRAGKPVPQFFYVGGYAGVGKTFLVKFFMEMVGLKAWDVRLMTFMARSALILSNASGLPASTIHSNIYKSELRRGVEEWVLDRDSNVRNAKLFILDECSMVGTNMFKDLTSFGRPILILGDPGQLLPIGDDILFPKMQPHYFLTEIRRQALDNPIIKLSMLARKGRKSRLVNTRTDKALSKRARSRCKRSRPRTGERPMPC
jgi:exodeoxyribonuclease-5